MISPGRPCSSYSFVTWHIADLMHVLYRLVDSRFPQQGESQRPYILLLLLPVSEFGELTGPLEWKEARTLPLVEISLHRDSALPNTPPLLRSSAMWSLQLLHPSGFFQGPPLQSSYTSSFFSPMFAFALFSACKGHIPSQDTFHPQGLRSNGMCWG